MKLVALCLYGLIATTPCLAVEQVPTILSIQTRGLLASGKSYRIDLALREQTVRLQEKHWVGVDAEQATVKLIDTFTVHIADRAVLIPPKAFADLTDIHLYQTPSLMEDGVRQTLSFLGSDGAGAYQVDFTFSEGRLVRRQIREYHGQFVGKDITIDERF